MKGEGGSIFHPPDPSHHRLRFRIYSLAVLFLMLLAVPSALLFPYQTERGNLNLSLWNRSYFYGGESSQSDRYENLFRLDFQQDMTHYGTLSAWIDGLVSDGGYSVSLFRLEWRKLRAMGWSMNFGIGDGYFQFTNMTSRFTSYYHPYHYLRGARASFSRGVWNMDVWAGKSSSLTGLLGTTYQVGEQTQAGFKARANIRPDLVLGTGFVLTGRETDSLNDLVIGNNRIVMVDGEYRPRPWLTFLGEWKLSSSREEGENRRRSGSSLIFGPLIRTEKIDFEANYRFTGSDFRHISLFNRTGGDREGVFSSLRYRAHSYLTLFSNLDRYRSQTSSIEENSETLVTRMFAGFSLRKPTWPFLTARLETAVRKPREGTSLRRSTRGSGMYFQISRRLKKWYPYLRYRFYRTRGLDDPAERYDSSTFYFGTSYSSSRSTTCWMETEWERTADARNNYHQSRGSLKLGWRRYVSHRFSLRAEAILRRYNAVYSSHRLEISIGGNYDLPAGLTLRADIRTNSPLNQRSSGSTTWLTIKVNKRFDWGAPAKILGKSGEGEVTGIGRIEGFIFLDVNQNGAHDPGEQGIAGVGLILEDGSRIETDSKGRYEFRSVAEGIHRIELQESKIPAFYYILGPTQVSVAVSPRHTSRFDFVLTLGASLSGRIIDDKNKNQKLDEEESGLKDVLVLLKPVADNLTEKQREYFQNLVLNTYTDSKGEFVFDNIIPGKYELMIDKETLPEGAEINPPHPKPVVVPPGKNVSDQLIYIFPRRIIIRQVKSR